MCLCLSSLKLSNWISSQKESRGWEWVYVNFHNVTTFAAKKAAEGRRWKGLFSAQDQTKKQQLWWWERRKQKWKGRFLTRWGMMTSTLPGDRRYVSVLWPLPASGNSCWIKPGCYFPLDLFHSFLLAGMDGRINLIISVEMLHGFTVATVEIKIDQIRYVFKWYKFLSFGIFNFLLLHSKDWKHSCRHADLDSLRVSVYLVRTKFQIFNM